MASHGGRAALIVLLLLVACASANFDRYFVDSLEGGPGCTFERALDAATGGNVPQCEANVIVSPQDVNEVSFDVGELGTSSLVFTTNHVLTDCVRLVSPSTRVTLTYDTTTSDSEPFIRVVGNSFASAFKTFQMSGLSLLYSGTFVTGESALLVVSDLDTLELSDCSFEQARVRRLEGSGGAAAGTLFAERVDSVTVSMCTFTGSTAVGEELAEAVIHGALYVTSALQIHINDCVFTDSLCLHELDTFSHSVGKLDAGTEINFVRNSVLDSTGGNSTLSLDSDTILVEDCIFDNNVVDYDVGGALEIKNGLDVTIICNSGTTCYFKHNDALTDGGALYLSNSNVTLFASDPEHAFQDNEAVNGAGGAIYADATSTIRMFGPWKMEHNSARTDATSGGGAVYVAASSFTYIGAGTISTNSATHLGRGGAVYAHGDILVDGVKEVIGNRAATGGGAFCSANGSIDLVNVLGSIRDNDGATTDTGEGGGVALTLTQTPQPVVNITMLGSIPGSTLAENRAGSTQLSTLGGGVIRTSGRAYIATCVAEECTALSVFHNTSPDGGGVIRADGVVTALFGPKTSLEGNAAHLNGGVIMAGAVADFTAGTALFNTAGEHGGVIYSCGDTHISSVGTLDSNMAVAGSGGAVFSEGPFSIDTLGDATAHTAAMDGGVFFALGNFEASSLGSFSENDAGIGRGGAIYSGAHLNITSMGDLVTCSAGDSGGAVYAGSATIGSVGFIHDNSAALDGGAICTDSAESLTIYSISSSAGVTENSAQGKGGAFSSGIVTIHSTEGPFALNTALGKGGVLYASVSATVTANSQAINDNTGLDGGAFYVVGELTVNDAGDVLGNTARFTAPHGDAAGGAFWGDTVAINGMGDASGNTAASAGGCIFATEVSVSNAGNFSLNMADTGGAIYGTDFVSVVNTTAFDSNEALRNQGGAICGLGVVNIDSVGSFNWNIAEQFGGAISAQSVNLTRVGSLSHNMAMAGPGGAISGSAVTVEVLNITGNTALFAGGALSSFGLLDVLRLDYAADNGCLPNQPCLGGVGWGFNGVYLSQLGEIRDNGNFFTLGGAFASEGFLTLDYADTFFNNHGRSGGALYSIGSMTIGFVGSLVGNQANDLGTANPVNGNGGAFYCESCEITVTNLGPVISNTATSLGGAIAGGSLNINATNVSNNSAGYGGAFFSNLESTIALTNGASFNRATLSGGLAYMGSSGTLQVEGSLFNNTAVTGSGGVTFAAGALTCNALGDVFNNTAAVSGGAFFSLAAITITNGGDFVTNTANIANGGVASADFGIAVTNVGNVVGNYAAWSGGAFFTANGDVLLTHVGNVTGNSCDVDGGAIRASVLVSIQNADSINGNSAKAGNGGAATAAIVHVIGATEIIGNMALSGLGGAFYAQADVIVTDCPGPLEGNMATWGGLAYAANAIGLGSVGDIRLNNATTADGGACYATGMLVVTQSGAIEDNWAGGDGGAFRGSYVELDTVTNIARNFADNDGGVIVSTGGVVVENVGSIEHNTANGDGGVIFATEDVSITNSVKIEGNRAGGSGGVIVTCGFVTLENNGPVLSNSADHMGVSLSVAGALYNNPTSSFYNNSAANGSGGIAVAFISGCDVPVMRSLDVTAGDVIDNRGHSGGAFFTSADDNTFHSLGIVSGNRASFDGGFLWSTDPVTFLAASGFYNNSASSRGNIVYANNALTFEGNMGDVIGNGAFEYGEALGGFACSAFEAENAVFGNIEDNKASRGAFVDATGPIGTVFIGAMGSVINNTAEYGGAIAASGAVTIFTAGNFIDNYATKDGAVIQSVGALDITTIGDVTGNTSDRDGSVVFCHDEIDIQSIGKVSFNTALGCGAFCALGDVAVVEVLDIRNNTASDGAAFYSSSTVDIISINDTVGNIAVSGSGGAIFAGMELFILSMGDVVENTAIKGGALYSVQGAEIGEIGNVRRNAATESGGFLHAEGSVHVTSVLEITDNFSPSGAFIRCDGALGNLVVEGMLGNIERNSGVLSLQSMGEERDIKATILESGVVVSGNQGTLFDNGNGDIDLRLNETAFISNKGNIATATGNLDLQAFGSSFNSTVQTSLDAALFSADGTLRADRVGNIIDNEGPQCLFQGGKLLFTNMTGNVLNNRAVNALFCATANLTFVRLFPGDDHLSIASNEAPIAACTGELTFNVVNVDIEENRLGALALFFGVQEVLVTIEGAVRANQAPLARLVGVTGPNPTLRFSAREIRDTIAPFADTGSLFEAMGNADVVILGADGICNNTAGPNAPFPLISANPQVDQLSQVLLRSFGAVEGTAGGAGQFLFPSVPCSVEALAVRGSLPVPHGCSGIVRLQDPYDITAAGPNVVTPFEQVSIVVTVDLANDDGGQAPITILATADTDGYTLFGQPSALTTDGTATFSVGIAGPADFGEVGVRFEVEGMCSPVATVFPLALVSSSPAPSSTPSSSFLPSASKSPSTTRSPIVIPVLPSATSSITMSKTLGVSSSPSATPTNVATAMAMLSRSPSRLPLQGSPSVAAPPELPSSRPSPSRTRSSSVSRSPSRTALAFPTRTCQVNCVVPVIVPVQPTGNSQSVLFSDETGRPAGSVTLPASSVEAGETLLIGPASPDATEAAADLEVASDIVNVVLEDIFGISVQPNGDIEVCLTVSDVDEAKDNGCLSFYDEDRDRWVCEDPCLEFDGDTACGTTDHLTNFAVLLTGGNGDCSDDDDGYIFDAGWKDGVLVGSVFLVVVGVAILVLIIALLFPGFMARLHGKEYTRIRSLRSGRVLSDVTMT